MQGFSCSRGTGNHIQCRGASATQILMRKIEQFLIVGVGVNRGHGAAVYAERLVQYLGNRGETICGARRVRNHIVLRGIVRLLIHAKYESGIRAIRRRRDDDLLHGAAQVRFRLLALCKQARRFHNNIGANARPVNLGRIFYLEYFDSLPFDRNCVVGMRNGMWQVAQNRIVLQ